jgi:heptosyltransferase-2
MVERFAALGLNPGEPLPARLPTPALRVRPDSVTAALERQGVESAPEPILALCPGAQYGPAKRWPVSYFAEIARAKLAAGWQVWIFGSSDDTPFCQEIDALTGNACWVLAGKTDLAEAVDLLSLSSAVVSNDSGLMHVAAALGRELVVVYGSSTPDFTPPLSERARTVSLGLSCSPCFERRCPLGHTNCLNDLPPERVLAALDRQAA